MNTLIHFKSKIARRLGVSQNAPDLGPVVNKPPVQLVSDLELEGEENRSSQLKLLVCSCVLGDVGHDAAPVVFLDNGLNEEVVTIDVPQLEILLAKLADQLRDLLWRPFWVCEQIPHGRANSVNEVHG